MGRDEITKEEIKRETRIHCCRRKRILTEHV
jgi:hypothetical protein